MSESNPLSLTTASPETSDFFSRSPFSSWQFRFNTVLLAIVFLAVVLFLSRYWAKLNEHSDVAWVFLLIVLLHSAVYPYWWALIRHAKIRKLYLAARIPGQSASPLLDELMKVADDSINEGLRNTMFCFLLFLLGLFLWRIR
jgi:hypothetical protein